MAAGPACGKDHPRIRPQTRVLYLSLFVLSTFFTGKRGIFLTETPKTAEKPPSAWKGGPQGKKITLPTGFDTLFPAGLVRCGHSLSNTSALHVPALRPVRAAASDPTIHLSPDRIGQGRFFGRPVEMRRKVPLQ